MTTRKRFKCRSCSTLLPAWLPVAKRPEGPMLLYHLGQHRPDQIGPYLERMRTEDIATGGGRGVCDGAGPALTARWARASGAAGTLLLEWGDVDA